MPLKETLLLQGPNCGKLAVKVPHSHTFLLGSTNKKFEGDVEMKN